MTTAADVDAHECNASPALLVATARELLSRYAPFRGRLDALQFEAQSDLLTVRGTVPTFYLRHLLQSALRQLPASVHVVNRVEVACPHGISACSPATRARCAIEFKILGKVPICFPTCPGTPGSTGDEE